MPALAVAWSGSRAAGCLSLSQCRKRGDSQWLIDTIKPGLLLLQKDTVHAV